MMIIVSLMLLNEDMLQETKIITLPIYNTEFRIYNIYNYISGPPSEGKKPPPSSGSAHGLEGVEPQVSTSYHHLA